MCKKGDTEKGVCERMAKNGFCKSGRLYKQTKIVDYCPDSCGLCEKYKKPNTGKCEDLKTDCVIWANLGLCKKIEDEMEDLCRKSCGLC